MSTPPRLHSSASRKHDISHLSDVRVLIIDSDTLIPGMTRDILKSFGFQNISHCRNSTQGLRKLDEEAIDLVISEWPMEPKSGVNIVRYIRSQKKEWRRVPIILITGKGEERTVNFARDAGMTEFLVKPFKVETLCQRIIQVVDNPREFILSTTYVGPDRRRKTKETPQDRRVMDRAGPECITRKGNLTIKEYEQQRVVIADPDSSIRKKIGVAISLDDIFTKEAIEKAEKVVHESTDDFLADIADSLQWLGKHLASIKEDHARTGRLAQMSELALSIKGKAGMFDYDLATVIAKSLRDYIDEIDKVTKPRIDVINEHINSLKVIFAQNLKGMVGDTGETLINYMAQMTERCAPK